MQTAESQLMTAQQTIATQERMLKEQEYMRYERNVKEGEPTASTSWYRVDGTYTIESESFIIHERKTNQKRTSGCT